MAGRIKRAASYLAICVIGAGVIASSLFSGFAPQNLLNSHSWLMWAQQDPAKVGLLGFTAVISATSAISSFVSLFVTKPITPEQLEICMAAYATKADWQRTSDDVARIRQILENVLHRLAHWFSRD